jgi:hypothetical protein
LNLPGAEEAEAHKNLLSAQMEIEAVSQEWTNNGERFPATLVVLTNYPHHYGLREELDPLGYQSIIAIADPAHRFVHPDTQGQIVAAMSAYSNLPRSWDDFD